MPKKTYESKTEVKPLQVTPQARKVIDDLNEATSIPLRHLVTMAVTDPMRFHELCQRELAAN